ncbi:NIPSNAP family protein [Vineibacter terrae]|uniref:NIPSNAP family protein n=1 Tax=Vineibacter terrae TaxID=2586908 RepID=A0A5C8PHJ1_9HYPH|nr:NIPSNAP family protein [Vineibacter terrae]TXL73311.1 NIPSNAP family protein [Vineibacter terrae]
MIYELRTYTLHPGTMPKYLELAEKVGRPARGDNYGLNHGYWTSEFGQLNQIWHLWSYPSADERARLRAELQKNEQWTKAYVPAIRPLLQRQDLRLLNAVVDPRLPGGGAHLYEVRIYRTQVGMAQPWAELIKSYLPVREKYSPLVGLWYGEFPQPNEAVHLWAYTDLNARMAARAAVGKDPGWQEFIGKSSPQLVEMQSVLLIPTSYSPMK